MIALPTIATAVKTSENNNQTDHNPSKHYIYINKSPDTAPQCSPFSTKQHAGSCASPNTTSDGAQVQLRQTLVQRCKDWNSRQAMHGYTTASADDDTPASYTSCAWQIMDLCENWGSENGLSSCFLLNGDKWWQIPFSDTLFKWKANGGNVFLPRKAGAQMISA